MRTADSTPLNGMPADEAPLLAANAAAQPPQSVGVFGALFGPGSQPQPVAAAYTADASAVGQPQPAAMQGLVATPAGAFNGPTVAMVAGKNGELAPPKKWTRDGGTTTFARGDQGLENVTLQPADDAGGKHHRSRKITTVATLDVPPGTAQAYAAAPAQDPRFAAAASQAAIAQATSGQPVQQVASSAAQVAPTATPDDEKPSKHKHARHAKHHHKSDATTQVAESKATDAPAPTLRPTAAQ